MLTMLRTMDSTYNNNKVIIIKGIHPGWIVAGQVHTGKPPVLPQWIQLITCNELHNILILKRLCACIGRCKCVILRCLDWQVGLLWARAVPCTPSFGLFAVCTVVALSGRFPPEK